MFDLAYIISLCLSIFAVVISYKIRHDKNYSRVKLFGISVVNYALIYFALIAISILAILPFYTLVSDLIIFELLLLSIFGAVVSIGLLIIEIRYAKCIPRLIIPLTVIALILPVLIITDLKVPIESIFQKYFNLIVIIHLFGFALGLGGATYSDILLMKFLKDFKISPKEANVINTLSQTIWIGVAVLTISGVAIFLSDAEAYMSSAKFLSKMTIFLILVINGLLLHLYMLPRVKHISFEHDKKEYPELTRLRKGAFLMGAVSLVSWYAAFVLGGLRDLDYSYQQIMSIYGVTLLIAIIGSLISDSLLVIKAKKKS